MACKLKDWLTQIKLNTWRCGQVEGVGYVVLDDSMDVGFHYAWDMEDLALRSCGVALSAHLSLVKQLQISYSKARGVSEHRLWMAVRDVFSGEWEIRVYRLICLYKEDWIRDVTGVLRPGKNRYNAYQISKKHPFELKDRGNYAVYGKELPQSRRFKS
ncbi:hypothetical protein [Saccharicrinis fermentans]|uniref:Uncharacterized protein n=1 Tax=Saccharicrinis fermentans DSM 9555 = JCM 21142 TaxID=869213 RepID=W7YS31_9BACT|nr:hypothetical protein [Saccharicrinis fermentans]GAF05249.1 hypothetical protein JCM21142_93976 [Saccharicrinis fermentans DSM 9555 = JCM 21142]